MSLDDDLITRRIGTTLRGKWTLERVLGVGGMAAVYVGRHKIGRTYAIKILHAQSAANKQIAARFEQEAHAVNRFHHPGAVEVLDIDVTDDGAPFLVMELLEGESLEARLARSKPSDAAAASDRGSRARASVPSSSSIETAEALRIADELLDVLAAAHAQGIVHRDIKPDNLFILPDGRLKVLDFGIARMRHGAPRTLHTAVGVAIGTLAYMPPEQVAGHDDIDARADLFSVGCTLFRLVSGRLPHEGTTDLELMVKMGMMPVPPLASVAPRASQGLCLVVDRALAFDKDRRYPDALTMQADVRALRAGAMPPFASAKMAAGEPPNPPSAGLLPSPPSPPSPPSALESAPTALRATLAGSALSVPRPPTAFGVPASPPIAEPPPRRSKPPRRRSGGFSKFTLLVILLGGAAFLLWRERGYTWDDLALDDPRTWVSAPASPTAGPSSPAAAALAPSAAPPTASATGTTRAASTASAASAAARSADVPPASAAPSASPAPSATPAIDGAPDAAAALAPGASTGVDAGAPANDTPADDDQEDAGTATPASTPAPDPAPRSPAPAVRKPKPAPQRAPTHRKGRGPRHGKR